VACLYALVALKTWPSEPLSTSVREPAFFRFILRRVREVSSTSVVVVLLIVLERFVPLVWIWCSPSEFPERSKASTRSSSSSSRRRTRARSRTISSPAPTSRPSLMSGNIATPYPALSRIVCTALSRSCPVSSMISVRAASGTRIRCINSCGVRGVMDCGSNEDRGNML